MAFRKSAEGQFKSFLAEVIGGSANICWRDKRSSFVHCLQFRTNPTINSGILRATHAYTTSQYPPRRRYSTP